MWVLGTQYSWNFTTGGLWPWGLLPTILLSATFAIFVQSCHALLSRNLLVVVVLVLLIPASDNTVVAYSKKNQYGTYFPLLIEKWQVMLQVHLTSSWLFQQVRTEETKQWNFLSVEHFVGLLYILEVAAVVRRENWPSFFPTSQLLEKLWPANCFFHRKMHDFFP